MCLPGHRPTRNGSGRTAWRRQATDGSDLGFPPLTQKFQRMLNALARQPREVGPTICGSMEILSLTRNPASVTKVSHKSGEATRKSNNFFNLHVCSIAEFRENAIINHSRRLVCRSTDSRVTQVSPA
jgi:hypothetical protein